MTVIDENTREQVTGLATRAKHLFRRSMRLAVVFGLLLLGTFGAFFLASHMEPSTALTSVDVPEKMFEVADLLGSHQGQHNSLFSVLMNMAPIFGIVAIIIGFLVIAGGNGMGGMGCIMMGIFSLIVIPSLNSLGFFEVMGAKLTDNSSASAHQHFVSEIKQDDFPSLRQQLKLTGRADEPVGLYLLAQMSIVEGKNQIGIAEDVIDRMISPDAGFTPNARALYAIEHAAYGRPKSEAALAYRDRFLSWQRWMQRMTMILGVATVVAGFFLAGMACVRYAIVGRVRRIERLCGIA